MQRLPSCFFRAQESKKYQKLERQEFRHHLSQLKQKAAAILQRLKTRKSHKQAPLLARMDTEYQTHMMIIEASDSTDSACCEGSHNNNDDSSTANTPEVAPEQHEQESHTMTEARTPQGRHRDRSRSPPGGPTRRTRQANLCHRPPASSLVSVGRSLQEQLQMAIRRELEAEGYSHQDISDGVSQLANNLLDRRSQEDATRHLHEEAEEESDTGSRSGVDVSQVEQTFILISGPSRAELLPAENIRLLRFLVINRLRQIKGQFASALTQLKVAGKTSIKIISRGLEVHDIS